MICQACGRTKRKSRCACLEELDLRTGGATSTKPRVGSDLIELEGPTAPDHAAEWLERKGFDPANEDDYNAVKWG